MVLDNDAVLASVRIALIPATVTDRLSIVFVTLAISGSRPAARPSSSPASKAGTRYPPSSTAVSDAPRSIFTPLPPIMSTAYIVILESAGILNSFFTAHVTLNISVSGIYTTSLTLPALYPFMKTGADSTNPSRSAYSDTTSISLLNISLPRR